MAHFCLERRDPTSGLWLKTAFFSAPVQAVEPPPVTSQLLDRGRGRRGRRGRPGEKGLEDDDAELELGWEAWCQGGLGAWCRENPRRPSYRYLVKPAPPSAEFRLLWACTDLTEAGGAEGGGEAGGAEAAEGVHRVVPALLFHNLLVASARDLPFVSRRPHPRSTDGNRHLMSKGEVYIRV